MTHPVSSPPATVHVLKWKNFKDYQHRKTTHSSPLSSRSHTKLTHKLMKATHTRHTHNGIFAKYNNVTPLHNKRRAAHKERHNYANPVVIYGSVKSSYPLSYSSDPSQPSLKHPKDPPQPEKTPLPARRCP